MATICVHFHLHQAPILRRYSVFDEGGHYVDAFRSREACRQLAERCVIPVNKTLLMLLRKCDGRFRVSLAL